MKRVKTNKIKYIKNVNRAIKTSSKNKQKFILQFTAMVEESADDDITFEELCEIFGSPNQVAEEARTVIDNKYYRSHKKKFIALILTAVIAIIGLLIGFYVYLVYCAVEPMTIETSPVYDVEDVDLMEGAPNVVSGVGTESFDS